MKCLRQAGCLGLETTSLQVSERIQELGNNRQGYSMITGPRILNGVS